MAFSTQLGCKSCMAGRKVPHDGGDCVTALMACNTFAEQLPPA